MKSRHNDVEKFVVYGLLDTYHSLGEYKFKIVLNPKHFKNSHDLDVQMNDSDGETLKFKMERWGRKMNVSFTLDDDVSDGITVIMLLDKTGNVISRLSAWIIK